MEFTYTIPTDPTTGEPSKAVVVRSDGWNIPQDPANSDYQAYLAYVANGNKVPSESSIPTTPQAGE